MYIHDTKSIITLKRHENYKKILLSENKGTKKSGKGDQAQGVKDPPFL